MHRASVTSHIQPEDVSLRTIAMTSTLSPGTV